MVRIRWLLGKCCCLLIHDIIFTQECRRINSRLKRNAYCHAFQESCTDMLHNGLLWSTHILLSLAGGHYYNVVFGVDLIENYPEHPFLQHIIGVLLILFGWCLPRVVHLSTIPFYYTCSVYIRNNREALLGLPFMCPVRWLSPQGDRSFVDINPRVTDPLWPFIVGEYFVCAKLSVYFVIFCFTCIFYIDAICFYSRGVCFYCVFKIWFSVMYLPAMTK